MIWFASNGKLPFARASNRLSENSLHAFRISPTRDLIPDATLNGMADMRTTPDLRILVADDDTAVRARLGEQLAELANVVIIGMASDGGAALECFNERHPHVAILDFSMPVANGLEVLRAIRRSGKDCMVVVLTVNDEPTIRESCLAAGADHFLSKVTELDRVLDIVAECAARIATERSY